MSNTTRRTSRRTRGINRYISTTNMAELGKYFSNLALRLTRQFTRRNRDHLVVPSNTPIIVVESNNSGSKNSGSKSNRSSKNIKRSRSLTYVIPSSQLVNNPELVIKSSNSKSKPIIIPVKIANSQANEFTALGLKSNSNKRKLTKSNKKRK